MIRLNFALEHAERPPAQIDRDLGFGLVHRQDKAKARHADAVAQCLFQRGAEDLLRAPGALRAGGYT